VIQDKDKFSLSNWEIVSVNPKDKTWTWKSLFCFWANSFQSIVGFSLITSLYVVYNLNFLAVSLGLIIGSLLIYFFVNLIGKPSQIHGIPFPVFLRISMGINGAKYVALIRGIVGIFMFGIQTFFISISFGYVLRIILFSFDKTILNLEIFQTFYYYMTLIDWTSFIFAIFLQFFLFSKGHLFNKTLINFFGLFVYLGLLVFLTVIISENFGDLKNSIIDLINIENFYSKENFKEVATIAGTFFGFFSIIILNFGDFSRYVKNDKELKKGNLSLILNLLIFSIVSVAIVIGADIILNKNNSDVSQIFTNPTDIIGKFNNNYLTICALMFMLAASLSTNMIANYVPSQNTLINFLPNALSLKTSGLIIIIFGGIIGIFWNPILSQIGILSVIDTLGCFFGPTFGIIVTDYYLIKQKKITNKDIFSSLTDGNYYYSGGWHIKALYSLFIGFIFSAATIWNPDLRFFQSFSWLIGLIITSMTYYLLAKR